MISICIPYIREAGMERCIKALYAQKEVSFLKIQIMTYHDERRIGCPKALKILVDKSKYDLVMFLGDDTVPEDHMVIRALDKMNEFEDGWGLVGLNDQFRSGEDHATHWLGHKKLLEFTGGEFFHTGYKHCFCDNELIIRSRQINRYKYAKDAILHHLHPIVQQDNSLADNDYMRVYSQSYMDHDRDLFFKRVKNNWNS